MLGNDVSKLARAIEPCKRVLQCMRQQKDVLILHTREGHRPCTSDLYVEKKRRSGSTLPTVIGTDGPKGRILIRGEDGHDIISDLYPKEGEPVIDKPGKGSFYATDLELILRAQRITTLLVCGVTTEVCVHTTIREANDRGFHCIAIADACASYTDKFHESALEMISAQGGIFGSVTTSEQLVAAFEAHGGPKTD